MERLPIVEVKINVEALRTCPPVSPQMAAYGSLYSRWCLYSFLSARAFPFSTSAWAGKHVQTDLGVAVPAVANHAFRSVLQNWSTFFSYRHEFFLVFLLTFFDKF